MRATQERETERESNLEHQRPKQSTKFFFVDADAMCKIFVIKRNNSCSISLVFANIFCALDFFCANVVVALARNIAKCIACDALFVDRRYVQNDDTFRN